MWLAALLSLVSLVSLALAGHASAESEGDSLTETWYVLRGRANMKIGNYKAAIEAFEKAVELDPANREAMRTLGLAYENQGLTDKAIEQFDRYLERFDDDPEIAFKQADHLSWERYAYRRDDAIRFYQMGLAVREDIERRHVLARLLAQEKGRLDAALEQYRILLSAQPTNEVWRAEYRELLLWDPDHLDEAIEEHRKLARRRPNDFEVHHRVARLVARRDARDEEALTLYADLASRRPGDLTVRLEYARLLAGHRDRRDDALEQYEHVLRTSPTYESRVEYADLLSGMRGRRGDALDQYARLLRQRPDDVSVRVKYARLLAGEPEDTERAIEQFDLALARDPENAAAHQGLAAAYAWLGDRDRALAHANSAARYGTGRGRGKGTGTGTGEIDDLRESLLVGREPRLQPIAQGLVQRGRSKSELNGIVLGLMGRFDPTPFATIELAAGFEDYWSSGDNTAGGYFDASGEFRIDPMQRVDLELGYHSLGMKSGRNVVADLGYARDGEELDLGVGFSRTLRYDSYVGLVGKEGIGAARENRFRGRLRTERGPLDLSVAPYFGWVDSLEVGSNPFVGLRGALEWKVYETARWNLRGTLAAEAYHYRDDAFSIDPLDPTRRPGGYFSPQLFFETVPGVAASVRWGDRAFLDVEGGPALQLTNEAGSSTEFKIGGYGRVSYLLLLGDSMFWRIGADLVQLSDAYTRVGWQTSLTFEF